MQIKVNLPRSWRSQVFSLFFHVKFVLNPVVLVSSSLKILSSLTSDAWALKNLLTENTSKSSSCPYNDPCTQYGNKAIGFQSIISFPFPNFAVGNIASFTSGKQGFGCLCDSSGAGAVIGRSVTGRLGPRVTLMGPETARVLPEHER